MFTATFEMRSAMQVISSTAFGNFRIVFAVEMTQEVMQHCQNKDAGFYGLLRKDFTQIDI
jgi:hypothetical protein